MSGAAKFLVTTIGGGLLLGAVGGHLANPVMMQRGGDEPWRQMLEPGQASGAVAEAPPQDLRPYGGRYSYAPAYADDPVDAWQDPYMEAEWLAYEDAWTDIPTVAELDAHFEADMAETAAYGRTVEFPETAAEDTAARAEQAVEEARDAGEPAPAGELPPEPRVARGELPAIW